MDLTLLFDYKKGMVGDYSPITNSCYYLLTTKIPSSTEIMIPTMITSASKGRKFNVCAELLAMAETFPFCAVDRLPTVVPMLINMYTTTASKTERMMTTARTMICPMIPAARRALFVLMSFSFIFSYVF